MTRSIYLVIFSNKGKPAHWAVLIPTQGSDRQAEGKLIHVTGNPATGFFLEFKRNYDVDSTARRHLIISLGQVDDRCIVDTPGVASADTTARDRLESAALDVQPPPKSANPFDKAAPNCQNWIFDYVDKLIDDEYLDESARAVVQAAPTFL